MITENTKKILSKLPDKPGVYFFVKKNKTEVGVEYKKILYIGKATCLKDRVRSYFSSDIMTTRGPLIVKMLDDFTEVEFTETDSVLEALVLEAYLIKKHQPEANIKEKDNKSFNFVVITNEEFPMITVIRSRELLKSGISKDDKGNIIKNVAYSFGPFPNGSQLREALKIIRRMFPYRDNKCNPPTERIVSKIISGKNQEIFSTTPASEQKPGKAPRPCFNYHLGLCPGVCIGKVTPQEYAQTIKNIILFFEGGKKRLVKNLEKQMNDYAKEMQFEKASKIKRTMFTLNHIQDISLIKEDVFRSGPDNSSFRIESYDVAHMSGQNVVGVMTVVEDGELIKSDYRKFKIRDNPGVNDTKALSEVLARRLAHIEWKFPDLIVVDGGIAQKNAINKVLRQNGQNIPVVSVVKDERHRPREILGDKKWLKYEREIILSNSEAHRYGIAFHKQLRGKIF